MKKYLSIFLALITALSLTALVGCGPEKVDPVYAETYTQGVDEEGKFVHYRELLEGSEEDAQYLDYARCSNKKGRCSVCYRYYECTALVYTLNEEGTGLVCYGAADPTNYMPDSNLLYPDSGGDFNVSSFDSGGWLHVEIPKTAVYNGETYPVLELAQHAFAFDQIQSIKLNEGLLKIGRECFKEISGIKEVIIPQSVDHVAYGGSFFWGCTNLEYVDIGGISIIPNYCFYNCRNLKNVKTSSNLKRIGFSAFNACTNLEYIILPSGFQEMNSDPRYNGINNDNVYDPFGGVPLGRFAIYCDLTEIPRGNYSTGEWNSTGHKVYLRGQWEYDANGVPKAI